MLRASDAPSARLFVEAAAAAGARAWARPSGSGWTCGLGQFPEGEDGEVRPSPAPPSAKLGESAPACAAGALARLAGLPEAAAQAVGGGAGWRWAQANLPEPAPHEIPKALGAAVFSGAQACLAVAAPDLVAGVEGESSLAGARGASDSGMAAWLACGAAAAGARALAEAGPAESEAAAAWSREAGLALLLLGADRGAEDGAGRGPSWLAGQTAAAVEAAEAGSTPVRIVSGRAPLLALETMASAAAVGRAAAKPAESGVCSAGLPHPARPPASLARAIPAAEFLEDGACALERVLAEAASACFLRPADLFIFSAPRRRHAMKVPQAWGLGEGAAPAAAGARLHDPGRKCVARVRAPRGMALGWLLHLAARNADLVVVAEGADATTLAALEASGAAFHARLRPSDGAPAAAALEAALRHRGLAFVELSEKDPTAVLRDAVRPQTWEETPA